MKISGTFLKSKTAKQIAILLLIAALIPASLMAVLSYNKNHHLVTNYEHQSLVDKSQNYALTAFSNLTFARSTLRHIADDPSTTAHPLIEVGAEKLSIFSSLQHVNATGESLDDYVITNRYPPIPRAMVQTIIAKNPNNHAHLVVLPSGNTNDYPSVNIVLPQTDNGRLQSLLIAKINPNFLWGNEADYPSNFSVCAYQLAENSRTKLFCSTDEKHPQENIKPSSLNSGSWELFLRGEFYDNSWIFETKRLNPISATELGSTLGSNAYIGIGILSLLVIGLLSLIQIRRTMLPLERLIDGTNRILKDDFSPVDVDGKSEFSALANAFNSMSFHIKQQIDTLQSLSSIDHEIAKKLDIDHLVSHVMARMQELKPGAFFCIALLNKKINTEIQCNAITYSDETSSSTRISIPSREIKAIEQYGEGHFSQCTEHSRFLYKKLMSALGANHLWVFPIFWQGEICAFISVGDKDELIQNDKHWDEFRELANRIGIAISAQTREDKLLLQAQYDALTGLPNRILLQDRLSQAMEYSDRTGNPLWVMFLDIDRFKLINDSMGHHAGDKLLTQVAERLQNSIKDADTVARFGGDEFVIILQGDLEENLKLAALNRLIDSVTTPLYINKQELICTCSIGITVYPSDGSTADVLIKNADIAMYLAKDLGRNNFQFFTQALNDKAEKRMRMCGLLNKALERDEFTLLYQPKVDLVSGGIVGMEALIRWNSPELGTVSPLHFIPLTEENGLILPIGEWVLRTACVQAAAWQKTGLGYQTMSVNLSVRQFNQENLVESIKSILIESGLKSEHLELELTESLLIDDGNNALEILHAIKSLGIQLSVDDFGTGYSSLSYLNSLPVDTLKIDKVFTDDIVLNNDKAPIVDTIISLAKNLGLKVIAEGVETPEQLAYLTARGCDQIQGYYFSRPVTAEAMEAMLASRKEL